MKKDRITKLYDGLSSHELAALAFNGSVNLDWSEMERIIGAVPKHIYSMPDADYMRRIEDIRIFALVWGMTHWKETALRYMANTWLLFGEKSADELKQLFAIIRQKESRLLALENVLIAVCGKYGVDPDAVRAWSGIDPFSTPFDNLAPDLAYQAEMQAAFEQILSDSQPTAAEIKGRFN